MNEPTTNSTDAELLAIVLTDGKNGTQTSLLAEELLDEYGSLAEIVRQDALKLRMIGGMGMARARRLVAIAEIMRRVWESENPAPIAIATSDDVEALMRPKIAALPHEELWVLYLSASNTLLESCRMSQGGVSATIFDHRLIVKRAIELLASSLVLVHNHPSDITTPSVEDLALTRATAEAAALFDIRLTDHLILAPYAVTFSFRRNKIL